MRKLLSAFAVAAFLAALYGAANWNATDEARASPRNEAAYLDRLQSEKAVENGLLAPPDELVRENEAKFAEVDQWAVLCPWAMHERCSESGDECVWRLDATFPVPRPGDENYAYNKRVEALVRTYDRMMEESSSFKASFLDAERAVKERITPDTTVREGRMIAFDELQVKRGLLEKLVEGAGDAGDLSVPPGKFSYAWDKWGREEVTFHRGECLSSLLYKSRKPAP